MATLGMPSRYTVKNEAEQVIIAWLKTVPIFESGLVNTELRLSRYGTDCRLYFEDPYHHRYHDYRRAGRAYHKWVKITDTRSICNTHTIPASLKDKILAAWMKVAEVTRQHKSAIEARERKERLAINLLHELDLDRRWERIPDENAFQGFRYGDQIETNLVKLEKLSKGIADDRGVRVQSKNTGSVHVNLNFTWFLSGDDADAKLQTIFELLEKMKA